MKFYRQNRYRFCPVILDDAIFRNKELFIHFKGDIVL